MPERPRFRWVVAGLLFSASALNFFDRQVLSVLAPQITAELRMSNVDYGAAVSAFTLAYGLMFTVGGRIIDHLGTRLGLGLTVAFWSLASAAHALVRSAGQLAVARLLLGVGEGGCFPGAAKAVVEWFPLRERALAMGIATTGGSALGAIAAPPVAVWIAARYGWQGAFLITGLAGALWVLAWFGLLRPPGGRPGPHPVDHQQPPANFTTSPVHWTTPWPLRRLLRRREVWALVVTRFLLDPVFYIYMFWIPQYLSQERGATLSEIGRLAWIPFLAVGLTSPIGGALSDWLVRAGWTVNRARKFLLGLAAASTPVSVLGLYVPGSLEAMMLFAVLMLAHGVWMTNYMTVIGDLFPPGTVATVVGFTGTAGGVGGVLANLASGYVIDRAGFAPVFIVCGCTYLAGFAILMLAIPRIQRLEP